MENPLFIAAIIGIAVLFILYNHYFNSESIILRRLKKLPQNRVGSLRTNSFSKISGKALNINAPLTAPLSKRKCVFYKITIQQRVNSGKSSRWETLIEKENIQDFFIEKNGERAIVLPVKVPRNYMDYLVTDKTTNSGTFNNPTPEFMKLLKFYNIDSETLFGFNKQLKYEEAIIEIGEQITVAGNVRWMDLENPIADYSYSSIVSLSGGDNDKKLIITDSPKAVSEQRPS